MDDPRQLHVCVKCYQEAQQRCSRCHVAWYCSAVCQRADWPLHKLICPLVSKAKCAREVVEDKEIEAMILEMHTRVPSISRWQKFWKRVLDMDLVAPGNINKYYRVRVYDNVYDETVLTLALSWEYDDSETLVAELLRRGADPNKKRYVRPRIVFWQDNPYKDHRDSYTPLHLAINCMLPQVVCLLLDHGANIEAGIVSPLEHAFERSSLECVDVLFRRGADARFLVRRDVAYAHGMFWHCIKVGHAYKVKKMLQCGADKLEVGVSGYHPLHIIAKNTRCTPIRGDLSFRIETSGSADKENCRQAAKIIKHTRNVDCRSRKGRTPLYYAVCNGCKPWLLGILLSSGSDFQLKMPISMDRVRYWGQHSDDDDDDDRSRDEVRNIEETTIIDAALRIGNVDFLDVFMEALFKNAKLTQDVVRQLTDKLLDPALEANIPNTVKGLINASDDPMHMGSRGDATALKTILSNKNASIFISTLLKRMSIDDIISLDSTYEDCWLLHQHVLPAMLTQNIRPEASRENINNLIRTAEPLRQSVKTILPLFYNACTYAAEIPNMFCKKFNHRAFKKCIEYDTSFALACTYEHDGRELPLIGWAVLFGNTLVFGHLIHAGANVNARDITYLGDTLLTLATSDGSKNMVLLLLETGADISIPRRSDGLGPLAQQTPVQIATRNKDEATLALFAQHIAKLSALKH